MSDLTSSLNKLQIEETRFRGAAAESVVQKIGGTINYFADKCPFVEAAVLASGTLGPTTSSVALTTIYTAPADKIALVKLNVRIGLSLNAGGDSRTVFILTPETSPMNADNSGNAILVGSVNDATGRSSGFNTDPSQLPATPFGTTYFYGQVFSYLEPSQVLKAYISGSSGTHTTSADYRVEGYEIKMPL